MRLAAISSDTTLSEGETTILACVGYGQLGVQVEWTRNGQPVTNTSLISAYQIDIVQHGLTFSQAFLQLCNVEMSDSGNYTCTVSSGPVSFTSTVQVTVVGKCLTGKVVGSTMYSECPHYGGL